MHTQHFLPLLAVAGLSATVHLPAMAQENSTSAIEEIVVTARKRGDESVQQIPISITALGETQLTQLNVADFEDFAYQIPGLTFNDQSPGERRYIIRGIQSAGQQQVAVYYDEIALPGVQSSTSDSGSQTPDLKLFDIERVEVLRGPQGTTFGANSQSGTVRIITKKPNLSELEGSASAEFGRSTGASDNNYEIAGMLNMPIIEDEFGVRLVAYSGEDAGYIDNRRLSLEDINSVETTGLRAALRWQPSDALTIDGMFWYQARDLAGDNRFHPFDTYDQFPGSDQGDLDNVAPTTLFETGRNIVGDYTQTPKPDDQTLLSVTANASLSFGDLTVTASTYERDFGFKFDSTWIVLFLGAEGVRDDLYPALTDQRQSLEQRQFEIRLSSNTDSALQWVVGAFYRDRESEFQSFVPVTNEDGLVFDPGTPFTGNSTEVGAGIPGCLPCVFARFADKQIEENALFGELSYTFADNWEATVGLRRFGVDQDEIGGTIFQFALFGGGISPPNSVSVDEDQTITKFGLSYRPSDDMTVYALRSEGFRLGGTNNQGIVAVPELFESDELVNYELGAKTAWFDGRLVVNAAIYQLDWENLQVAGQDPTGAFGFIGNAGSAEVRGSEIEVFARLYENWDFTAGVSWLPTRELTADQVSDEVIAPGLDGDLIPRIPEVTANFTAQYSYQLTGAMDAWTGFVRAEGSHKGHSRTELRPDSPNNRFQDEYQIFNFRAGFQNADKDLDIVLFVENAFDEDGDVFIGVGNGEPTFKYTNRPRTVGMEIRKGF